jgi:hypothetical protein
VGFLQAQLQQAHEALKLLQAPPDGAAVGATRVVPEEPAQTVVMAEEMGRLRAELEQAQQVAEFEAVTDELEREQQAEAAAAARRPWWRFWA